LSGKDILHKPGNRVTDFVRGVLHQEGLAVHRDRWLIRPVQQENRIAVAHGKAIFVPNTDFTSVRKGLQWRLGISHHDQSSFSV
jgi:hypothetical protein